MFDLVDFGLSFRVPLFMWIKGARWGREDAAVHLQ